ncbi:2,4-dienoyl-CoA reductase (NADPH2) [Desulfallas thermosapovorans DSM 6562]|uniref:2,4-dienoyl-CoA reductase (NADPH2) n=1 Tax=Desulfallas thermosapovorans DSM 6562 TaxID=1121431 RepID=A0A5S4ZX81_9FIRM|nr:2,4-dienoyl-CoA reductase (NADPH2) [Desulfallas thermosapovorans DSM 6562]
MILLSPIKIGRVELKNRVVMPAMHLGYCRDGFVSEQLVEFYRVRARGGVGLIMVGGCAIDKYGHGNMIRIDDDRYIPGLTELVKGVHSEGGKIAAQLFQPGRYSYSFLSGTQPVAPSPVPSKLTGQMPRALTVDEIQEIVEAFAQGAARAKAAGFDAVEAIGSAGYLISQFLSPVTNQRDDEYGGDFERRMRFGLEVARSIRAAVGPDYPVLFRVGGNDFMPGGNTNREMAMFCKRLEEAGVDAFNVTGGWHETRVPQITMAAPRGAFVYLARGIREAVNVPVIACNRINDPELAEEILASGLADLVGMARAMIADPDLVTKTATGQSGAIRKCIGCNQGCLDAVFTMKPVSCLVNARAGRELEKEPQPAQPVKQVLVVGGGPGGMEAARVAARRGHRVTLWEKGPRLGGQLNLAAVPPGREEFGTVVEYYNHELARLGVQIELGKEADEDNIKSFGADAVVMATGAAPIEPPIAGVGQDHVVQAWDVLAGKASTGKKVVIIGGGAVGCETALYLARKGTLNAEALHFLALNNAENWDTLKELATRGVKDVTVVEMQRAAGADIGVSSRWVILQEMRRFGVKTITGATAREINEGGVVLDVQGQEKVLEADTVVLAVGSRSLSDLCEKIKEQLPEVYMVGDAVAPRKALDAIYQGYLAGSVL